MSDKPATTLTQKKDRRGILALMGAGSAAAVAALLSQRKEAEAGHDGTNVWHLGQDNTLAGTSLSVSADPEVLKVTNSSSMSTSRAILGLDNAGIGVKGQTSSGTGVRGESSSGTGVLGTSSSGNGVGGFSSTGAGVRGNSSAGGAGVHGTTTTGNGVLGSSFGSGTGVRGEGKPGVYGISSFKNGSGVRGDGNALGSIGVFAKNAPGRRALRTRGRVQMDTVRKKSLANKSNLITLPTGVNAGSKAAVMATVQGNPGNDAVIWRAFRVDAKHIRIAFNKKPANPVSVAYWVVHPA